MDKDKTVYMIANADGSVLKKIVSDWPKNPDAKDTIAEKS